MRKEKDTLDLECKLTDVQVLAYSREMAENLSRRGHADNRKASFNSQIKAEIEELESKISVLSEKVKTGVEYRPVECKIIYDWKAGTRTWVRIDTVEEVRSAAIPAEDMQEHLKLEAMVEEEVALEKLEEVEENND